MVGNGILCSWSGFARPMPAHRAAGRYAGGEFNAWYDAHKEDKTCFTPGHCCPY